MKDRTLIRIARFVSMLFSPFIVPLLAFMVVFLFSYLSVLPLSYRLLVLGMVYCFTIFLPQFTIYLYRKINGWTRRQLGHRERRIVPYLLTIFSYIFCLLLMFQLNMPRYLSGIIIAALLMLIICVVINTYWKISTHMAAIGGLVGSLISFSILFFYNPVWWLCLSILFAGILGTSRIILRQHSLSQVLAGFGVGFLCGVLGIMFL